LHSAKAYVAFRRYGGASTHIQSIIKLFRIRTKKEMSMAYLCFARGVIPMRFFLRSLAVGLFVVGASAPALAGVQLWSVRDFSGSVVFDSFPFGPSSGNDMNFPLEQVPGQPTFATNFLGFQFLDNGTLWTARDFNGQVVFDSFPFGPSSGNDMNFPLEQVPGQPTFTTNFLGFQFLQSNVSSEVSEPASWAPMLAGLGFIGWQMRRRTVPAKIAA